MSNAADVIRPFGATHVSWYGGNPRYFKMDGQYSWLKWDFALHSWETAENVPRRLKPLNP